MKKLATLLFLLPAVFYAANEDKILILKKTDIPIRIDGVIDDAWAKADSATKFFQLQPYWGKPPSRKTYSKVLTTNDALYCIIVCYDDKKNIQQTTGKLDDFGGMSSQLCSILSATKEALTNLQ